MLTFTRSACFSALLRLVHVVRAEAEGLIIAHQMVVVMWEGEHVWVYQESDFVSIEGGEHLADSWDLDLALVELPLHFSEENTVGDGSVSISVWVVVQADDVALGNEVEEDGGEEGKETDYSAESGLEGDALDSYSCFQEDLWQDDETGRTGAVREELHPPNSSAKVASVNEVPLTGVGWRGEATCGWTVVGLHLVQHGE